MKFLPVALVTCGLALVALAEDASENAWRNRSWREDVTLAAGMYQGDGKPILIDKGRSVIIANGCVMDSVHFKAQGDVKWDVSGSFFRNSQLEIELGGKFTATNCAFDKVEMNKTGGWFVDRWSTRWKFENCVFAGKFSPPALGLTDYSFHASHCTFHDVELPVIKYKKDPSEEAQSPNLNFTNCHFYRCEVPESFLATTTECVFEECRFSNKRENFGKATHPILVTAYVVGRAAPPQGYQNGNLKVIFKGTSAPENGATVKYTYTDRHLALTSAPTKGSWNAIGIVDNKAVPISTPAPAAPARPEQ